MGWGGVVYAHLQEMRDRAESGAEMLIPLAPSLPGYWVTVNWLATYPGRKSSPRGSGFWEHLPSLAPSRITLQFTALGAALSVHVSLYPAHQINSSFIKVSSYYPIRACHLVPARTLPNTAFSIHLCFPRARTVPSIPLALNKFGN